MTGLEMLFFVVFILPLFMCMLGAFAILAQERMEEKRPNEAFQVLAKYLEEEYRKENEKIHEEKEELKRTCEQLEKEYGNACNHRH